MNKNITIQCSEEFFRFKNAATTVLRFWNETEWWTKLTLYKTITFIGVYFFTVLCFCLPHSQYSSSHCVHNLFSNDSFRAAAANWLNYSSQWKKSQTSWEWLEKKSLYLVTRTRRRLATGPEWLTESTELFKLFTSQQSLCFYALSFHSGSHSQIKSASAQRV